MISKYILFLTLILSSSFSFANKIPSPLFESNDNIITLVGENHLQDSNRSEFARELELFESLGGEVLSLEMVESSKQVLLDNYLLRLDNSELKLYDYLKKRWGYNTESYMSLIEEARKVGLILTAIDLPKNLWPKEVRLYPVPPSVSLVRAAREKHMSKVLCDLGEKKSVTIIGSFHTHKEFLPSAISKECSRSVSVKLINQN